MSPWSERCRRAHAALVGSAALVGACLLAGCVVGPNFHAPTAPETARYTPQAPAALTQGARASVPASQNTATATVPGLTLDSALPVPAQWWSLLGSARLDATIRAALTGNRTLAAAQARLAEAQEHVAESEAGLFPQVNLDATAGRVKYGPAFLGPEKLPAFSYFSVGPAVSYAFDYTGGVRRGVEQQRAVQEAQQQQLQAAALSLSGNVALQALALADAQAQLDSLTALLADDRRNLQLVQDAFDAGGTTRVDILNAQSQLANDQTLLAPLARQRALAADALALLSGRAPGDVPVPAFTLQDFHLPAALPLTLPSELAHRRPDILAAEARLHAATAAVGVASAALYPQISLSANASFQSNAIEKLFNAAGIGDALAGNLTAPLFNHGQLRARERAAADEMHAALADYQQTVLASFTQVADALQSLDHDQELLASEQAAVQVAAQNLALTRESFSAGNSGVLQVLDAQRSDQQARLGLVRAQSQRYQDAVQLLLALGGAISLPQSPTPVSHRPPSRGSVSQVPSSFIAPQTMMAPAQRG
ncbi:MAG TPA: efflux transporter outer membrane subunit [Steroidobacteraceae bacterium]|nr:efflux transporter outer membrane subunit [Steroidobacteraceae bacterium]